MLQMENDPSALIGYVVAIKRAAPELYNTLRQPGDTLETAEALLVRPAALVNIRITPATRYWLFRAPYPAQTGV
jgi:hypothetical protein